MYSPVLILDLVWFKRNGKLKIRPQGYNIFITEIPASAQKQGDNKYSHRHYLLKLRMTNGRMPPWSKYANSTCTFSHKLSYNNPSLKEKWRPPISSKDYQLFYAKILYCNLKKKMSMTKRYCSLLILNSTSLWYFLRNAKKEKRRLKPIPPCQSAQCMRRICPHWLWW